MKAVTFLLALIFFLNCPFHSHSEKRTRGRSYSQGIVQINLRMAFMNPTLAVIPVSAKQNTEYTYVQKYASDIDVSEPRVIPPSSVVP